MLARIVVRDLGVGVDSLGDPLVVGLGHRHGGQGRGPAQTLRVVQRTEAAELPAVEQAADPLDQVLLAQPEPLGRLGERPLRDGEAALQGVDDLAVHRVHHAAPSAACAGAQQ